jgi:hypothetical protein
LLVVVVGVAQPPRSGAVPVVQSAKPEAHAYLHDIPLQVVAVEFVALHMSPHALQLEVDERFVSQPFALGAVFWQSA